MKDQFPILELERLFVKLNEEIFRDEDTWFGSGLSHSIFTPAMTLWLMMLQALHQESLSGAISLLEQGAADLVLARNTKSKKAKTKNISTSTGGYAQARQRLEGANVEDFVEALNERLNPSTNTKDSYLLDGSILTLCKTNDIENTYPRHRNNHGASLPQMRTVFVANAQSGTTPPPTFGPETISEQEMSYSAMKAVPPGSTLIADANFGVFSVVSEALRLGLIPIFRLTEARAKSLLKKSKLPSEGEFEIIWEPSVYEVRKHPTLKDVQPIRGRIIITTLSYKGYRPIKLMIFTTASLSKDEVVAEYKKRHNIELDIRQLKVTLEADFITARSKEMVEKELLIRVAAHNLLRVVIREAALVVGVDPRRVSFKGILRYIKIYAEKIRAVKTDKQRLEIWQRFLVKVKQQTFPHRKKRRPTYPRKLRRNLTRFPLKAD